MPSRKTSHPAPADVLVIFGEDVDPDVFDRFAARLNYLPGDFTDDATYTKLASTIKGAQNPVLYLEIPPFADQGGEAPTPYEVLIHAALIGNNIRFTRQDGIAEQWRIMQPLLDKPPAIHPYAPGTWGPEAANKLTADAGGWRNPWVVGS
jgi:glucose-6-phosphate 1-dehydrogenase